MPTYLGPYGDEYKRRQRARVRGEGSVGEDVELVADRVLQEVSANGGRIEVDGQGVVRVIAPRHKSLGQVLSSPGWQDFRRAKDVLKARLDGLDGFIWGWPADPEALANRPDLTACEA